MSDPMMMSWLYIPSLAMICRRAAEKFSYFLFGGFVVEFDSLSRQNDFEFEKSVWSVDHLCQVLRRLDRICNRRCILKVFDEIQDAEN